MSKIVRKKTRKPIVFTRKKKNIESTTNDQLKCGKCNTIFSNVYTHCPKCGSEEWTGYFEVNPYTRMPLEAFLQLCGHLFWIGGTAIFLFLLWQTTSDNSEVNTMYVVGGICSLVAGLLLSANYFALSEIIIRILRVQRRLKAFHNTYAGYDTSDATAQANKNNKKHRSPLV